MKSTLLLLLGVGLVSCIPRARLRDEFARESPEPLPAVGDRGGSSSLALRSSVPEIPTNQQTEALRNNPLFQKQREEHFEKVYPINQLPKAVVNNPLFLKQVEKNNPELGKEITQEKNKEMQNSPKFLRQRRASSSPTPDRKNLTVLYDPVVEELKNMFESRNASSSPTEGGLQGNEHTKRQGCFPICKRKSKPTEKETPDMNDWKNLTVLYDPVVEELENMFESRNASSSPTEGGHQGYERSKRGPILSCFGKKCNETKKDDSDASKKNQQKNKLSQNTQDGQNMSIKGIVSKLMRKLKTSKKGNQAKTSRLTQSEKRRERYIPRYGNDDVDNDDEDGDDYDEDGDDYDDADEQTPLLRKNRRNGSRSRRNRYTRGELLERA